MPENTEYGAKMKQACIIDGTSIAGTGRVEGLERIISDLKEGDALKLIRDKDNYFDDWAVRILDGSGNRLGFVSCDCNEIISRMIDAGFHVEGVFDSSIDRDGWTDIKMKVMLYG